MNEQLYLDLIDFFRKYVHMDEEILAILVLWAVATYCYDLYPTFPILHIQGDFSTGKNRILDLLAMLCYKPLILSNLSSASLFRIIDAEKGTILIDEADSLLQSNGTENILLSGYKKGAKTSRSVQDNEHPKGYRPVTFEVYCPKVLVTREGIQNDALTSRSITIITSPKPKDSLVPDILPSEALVEGELLKKQIQSVLESQNKRSLQ